jgi:hypothetical protein
MGWWGEMGGPKQKGVVQYSTSLSFRVKEEKKGEEGGREGIGNRRDYGKRNTN